MADGNDGYWQNWENLRLGPGDRQQPQQPQQSHQYPPPPPPPPPPQQQHHDLPPHDQHRSQQVPPPQHPPQHPSQHHGILQRYQEYLDAELALQYPAPPPPQQQQQQRYPYPYPTQQQQQQQQQQEQEHQHQHQHQHQQQQQQPQGPIYRCDDQTCPTYSRLFKDQDSLDKHQREDHPKYATKGPLRCTRPGCSFLGLSFADPVGFRVHLRKDAQCLKHNDGWEPAPVNDSLCIACLKGGFNDLRKHERDLHGLLPINDTEDLFKQHGLGYRCTVPDCPLHDRYFRTEQDLNKHVSERHMPHVQSSAGSAVPVGTHVCKACHAHAGFATLAGLVTHQTDAHGLYPGGHPEQHGPGYRCIVPGCPLHDRCFRTPQDLNKHKYEWHHSTEGSIHLLPPAANGTHECKACHGGFEKLAELVAHQMLDHGLHPGDPGQHGPGYRCPVHDCPLYRRYFQTEQDLNKHVREWHMPHICKACHPHAGFATHDKLVDHQTHAHGLHPWKRNLPVPPPRGR